MSSCFSPFFRVDPMTGCTMQFPCGKCPNCRARRISGWSFRLMVHERYQENALFVTLTYDTDHVPITNKGFMNLSKRDCQLFFKRLRVNRVNGSRKVSYYLCGEYGGKSFRPHYHVILFNCSIAEVAKAWTLGDYHIGSVTGASVGYSLKYMLKPSRIPLHKNDDRIPEFQLCSKGLGIDYLNDRTVAWHKADLVNRYYLNGEAGKKLAMPRYYKDKIYTDKERSLIGAKFQKTGLEWQEAVDARFKARYRMTDEQYDAYRLSRDLEKVRKMNSASTEGRYL